MKIRRPEELRPIRPVTVIGRDAKSAGEVLLAARDDGGAAGSAVRSVTSRTVTSESPSAAPRCSPRLNQQKKHAAVKFPFTPEEEVDIVRPEGRRRPWQALAARPSARYIYRARPTDGRLGEVIRQSRPRRASRRLGSIFHDGARAGCETAKNSSSFIEIKMGRGGSGATREWAVRSGECNACRAASRGAPRIPAESVDGRRVINLPAASPACRAPL